MTFGEKLYEVRKSRNLSQEQLAEKCGITRQSVSKWELGQGYPETEKLLLLCRTLEVDLDYLLRDEIENRTERSRQVITNPYRTYLGKWVTLLLHDREYEAIPLAAITAMNDEYVIFEMKGKKAIIRTSDIKTISEALISKKKAAALSAVQVFDLQNGDNPYKILIGKKCTIEFRRGNISKSIFSGNVNVIWLPSTELVSVTDESMSVLFKNKEMFIKNADVVVVFEN